MILWEGTSRSLLCVCRAPRHFGMKVLASEQKIRYKTATFVGPLKAADLGGMGTTNRAPGWKFWHHYQNWFPCTFTFPTVYCERGDLIQPCTKSVFCSDFLHLGSKVHLALSIVSSAWAVQLEPGARLFLKSAVPSELNNRVVHLLHSVFFTWWLTYLSTWPSVYTGDQAVILATE